MKFNQLAEALLGTTTFGKSEETSMGEAIKGWKHAFSDLAKYRQDKKPVMLISLKNDGTESKMHDAKKPMLNIDAAEETYKRVRDLNPSRKIDYNVYVDNKLVGKASEIFE
ncbi:MAG TPA: hypothetical protein PLA71_00850 [Saccharofermentans sp.]|nr:hypothetical protein [Saccharofermentans sp.]